MRVRQLLGWHVERYGKIGVRTWGGSRHRENSHRRRQWLVGGDDSDFLAVIDAGLLK